MPSRNIAVIGAGVTGVTTAYELLRKGYDVTVIDRQPYPAMETSYANGGQLSACNAEVWNSWNTIWKGMKWMLRDDAPLLLNPSFSFHKYSWLAEFCGAIRHYRANTVTTVKMAITARRSLFEIAQREGIDFDLKKCGILHLYYDKATFSIATRSNELLRQGGLNRYAVTPEEISSIEPALHGHFYGGFYTPDDATGDIHKFTTGLAQACVRGGVQFLQNANVTRVVPGAPHVLHITNSETGAQMDPLTAGAVVVCAGVNSRSIAASLGDRINIYPVKGYSITVCLRDDHSKVAAPMVSLLDESAKIVTSRLGADRFRVAGTAEFNGYNRDIRADRIAPLVQWSRRLFPDMSTSAVIPWAGLRPMTPTMMPRVGRGKRPRIYYNTGHGHLGWTLSAATAGMICETVDDDLSKKEVCQAKMRA